MAIEIVPATVEHAPELGRICHEAFHSLHEHHRVAPDVPTEDIGRVIIALVIHRSDYVGAVAMENGRVVGSNFLLLADEVAGVGPLTVDPASQAKGVGKLLMQWAIDEARRRRGQGVHLRLFQEAVNTSSLSLYTKLGFQWRDAAVAMDPARAEVDDPTIRRMTEADLSAVDELSTRHYGFSRAKDAAQMLKVSLPAFVREREGRIVGYRILTLFGHASADTNEDLLALASHSARYAPDISVVLVPLSQDGLFRSALAAGYRVRKVINYMSLDAFCPLPGPSFPSIQC
jgi:predicted N-acetyltransferase YhbS